MLCSTKNRFVGVCFLATLSASFGAARANTIPEIVAKAKQAIVEILTYDQQNRLLKTGTGFFISPDGALLTNCHVISWGSSIVAKTPTGAAYFLRNIVTESEADDIAKLQFLATDFPYLTLGSSSSAVEGQRVLVIGNPEGLEGTVSDGIISAFRAERSKIQITAPISPGSSGPLSSMSQAMSLESQLWYSRKVRTSTLRLRWRKCPQL